MFEFKVESFNFKKYSNKQLICLPLTLLLVSILILGGWYLFTGSPVNPGIEFTGGTEITLISEELKNTGKPDDIVKKISLGKINKFKEENSLLTQLWVMEPKKKVHDIMKELNISNLKIKDFYRLKIGE